MPRRARFGLVTVSDRAHRGDYEDLSGPAMERYLEAVVRSPHDFHRRVIADERPAIEATLIELADEVGCDLVLTSGGTGPAARDVTPEATAAVCSRLLPGFGEEMRRASLAQVPTAVLSRQLAGLRGRCLVINLPGKPRAIRTCLDAVFGAVPDCLDLIGAARLEVDPEQVRTYRHPST
ncbi:MAG TPA: molybdopterin adenylyltransferase [Thermoanaerobaculia bacterium]|jgi:molybdopterin adenylyltransferase